MTAQPLTDAAPLLELRGQQARYRQQLVLDDLNISIRPGERIALLGKSGAGKSTLINLLFQKFTREGKNAALIPQDPGLVDKLSIWHNIYMGRLDRYSPLYNLLNLFYRRADRHREISALAEALQLLDILLKPAGETSGGQQQRAAIGRALYGETDLILADEPVANLDQQTAERCMALLTNRSQTTIIALHDVALAQRFCDRIIGLRDGCIALDCAAASADPGELTLLYSDAAD